MADKTKQQDTTSDGTMVSDAAMKAAHNVIALMWEVQGKLTNIGGMVMDIAKTCVKDAKERVKGKEAQLKLALVLFAACLTQAEDTFRESHKTKEDKAKLDDMFDKRGSWGQYVATISSAMKKGIDVEKEKSLSGLRSKMQAINEATRTRQSFQAKVGKEFNLDKANAQVQSEALKAFGKGGEDGLEAAREVMREHAVPAFRPSDEQLQKTAQTAAKAFTDQGAGTTAGAKVQQALTLLLKALRIIDIEEHGDIVAAALQHTLKTLNPLIAKDADAEPNAEGDEPTRTRGTKAKATGGTHDPATGKPKQGEQPTVETL